MDHVIHNISNSVSIIKLQYEGNVVVPTWQYLLSSLFSFIQSLFEVSWDNHTRSSFKGFKGSIIFFDLIINHSVEKSDTNYGTLKRKKILIENIYIIKNCLQTLHRIWLDLTSSVSQYTKKAEDFILTSKHQVIHNCYL